MVTYPKSWEKVELGEICHETTGSINPSHKPEELFTEYSMPAYDTGKRPVCVTGSSMLSARRRLTEPCILVNKLNVRKRRVWAVLKPESNAVCSFEFIPLSSDVADLVYLQYLTFSDQFTTYLEDATTGTSNSQKRVTSSDILSYEFILPPLLEQRAIAEVLSGFDKHLANLDELIAKKKAIRDGALEDLVTGSRRLSGNSSPWKQTFFTDCCNVLTGLTYSPDDVRTSGSLVLRSSNIQNGVLCFEDNVYVRSEAVTSPFVSSGDTLMCVRNGSAYLIGKTALIRGALPLNTTFGAFMSLLRPFEIINPAFLFYYTQSRAFYAQVQEVLGATINQITKRDLSTFTLRLPASLDEQQAIAEVLSGMDEEIRLLAEERAKVERLKLGAMDDLLTGRVRLPLGKEAA